MPASAQACVPSAPNRYRPTTAIDALVDGVLGAVQRDVGIVVAAGARLAPHDLERAVGPARRIGDPPVGVDRGDRGVGGVEDLRLGDDTGDRGRRHELDRLALGLRRGLDSVVPASVAAVSAVVAPSCHLARCRWRGVGLVVAAAPSSSAAPTVRALRSHEHAKRRHPATSYVAP